MPLLLIGAIPETNEVEINLWGGDAPALILGNDFNLRSRLFPAGDPLVTEKLL